MYDLEKVSADLVGGHSSGFLALRRCSIAHACTSLVDSSSKYEHSRSCDSFMYSSGSMNAAYSADLSCDTEVVIAGVESSREDVFLERDMHLDLMESFLPRLSAPSTFYQQCCPRRKYRNELNSTDLALTADSIHAAAGARHG